MGKFEGEGADSPCVARQSRSRVTFGSTRRGDKGGEVDKQAQENKQRGDRGTPQ